jgi:hypothetical protein
MTFLQHGVLAFDHSWARTAVLKLGRGAALWFLFFKSPHDIAMSIWWRWRKKRQFLGGANMQIVMRKREKACKG